MQPDGGDQFISVVRAHRPWRAMPIKQHTALEAFEAVLASAGATRPTRDPVDRRIIEDARGGYATFEGPAYERDHRFVDPGVKVGIIDSPADVGGWPKLRSVPAPADADEDGMPDALEIATGLDPADASDRNRRAPNGYTMFEEYLNSLG